MNQEQFQSPSQSKTGDVTPVDTPLSLTSLDKDATILDTPMSYNSNNMGMSTPLNKTYLYTPGSSPITPFQGFTFDPDDPFLKDVVQNEEQPNEEQPNEEQYVPRTLNMFEDPDPPRGDVMNNRKRNVTKRTSRQSTTSRQSRSPSTRRTRRTSRQSQSPHTRRTSSQSRSPHTRRTSRQSPHTRRKSRTRRTKTTHKKEKDPYEIVRNLFIHKAPYIKEQVRSQFLKAICSDSNVCLAFGKEATRIKQFFDYFTNFKYAISYKRISTGHELISNGFVDEITYERDNYYAYAIMKSSFSPRNDNLAYEYFVGHIINKRFYTKLPCFIETYGIYKLKPEEEVTYGVLRRQELAIQNYKYLFDYYPRDELTLGMSCIYSKYLSILIQCIKGARTLTSMIGDNQEDEDDYYDEEEKERLKNRRNVHNQPYPTFEKNIDPTEMFEFGEYDLASCLYQVYYCLNDIKDFYTHYDLHTSNILIYEPMKNKYINYHFYDRNTDRPPCTFKSRYVVKIIDYGRSFIKDPITGKSSATLYAKLSQEPLCNQNTNYHGDQSGYQWLEPPNTNLNAISSSVNNPYMDLRALLNVQIVDKIHPFVNERLRTTVLNRVHYTPREINNPYHNYNQSSGNLISTITDAEVALYDYLMSAEEQLKNETNYMGNPNYQLLGNLVIRSGQDMEFTHPYYYDE